MIRPTSRAVLIFASGIPLALFVVSYDPGLWLLSFNYGPLVLLVTGSDVLLAFPPRLLDIKIATPDKVYIGERGAITATIASTRWRRSTRFELIAEQRGEVEPAEIVAGEPENREPRKHEAIVWARLDAPPSPLALAAREAIAALAHGRDERA